jgi:hypothetical protein
VSEPRPRISFLGGGWIFILSALLSIGVFLWAIAGVITGTSRKGGSDVASYGFDLSTSLVPLDELTPSGQPRDFLRRLEVTHTMPGSAMQAFNERNRKRYVVRTSRVIGVQIGDEARAYPLYLLNGHEVIIDTLGGVPIAVTYSPLCDAIAVYDRRVNGRTLDLRLSGLLHQANGILYDDATTPSLWRQLDGKAIAGPAAERGETLTPIAGVCLTTWADWLAAHPDTDVPERVETNVRLYTGIDYRREHASQTVPFPHAPIPANGPSLKAPMLLLDVANERVAVDLTALKDRASDGVAELEIAGRTLRIVLPESEENAWRIEDAEASPIVARSAFWFAVNAIEPDRRRLP